MADLVALHDRLAEAHAGKIEAVLAKGMRAMIGRFAAEDIMALPDGFRGQVEAALRETWEDAARETEGLVADLIKADTPTIWERIATSFAERWGAAKVTRIVETTRLQLMRMIRAGIREGQSVPQIAKAMREAVPEIARVRSEVIARTETHQASLHASQEVARTARVPLVKVWVSVEDHRTRDFGEADGEVDEFSHRAMNGVEAAMDMPFMVPTKYGTREPLMHPGDPNGSAGNTINCRCAMTYRRAN